MNYTMCMTVLDAGKYWHAAYPKDFTYEKWRWKNKQVSEECQVKLITK